MVDGEDEVWEEMAKHWEKLGKERRVSTTLVQDKEDGGHSDRCVSK